MISPTSITNFYRNEDELQKFWLFCLFVAGKNSDIAARKINEILANITSGTLFFDVLKSLNITDLLTKHKVGQYNRLNKAVTQSLPLNLKTVSLNQLLDIHGVGPKTARFFLLHSRENCNHAVLDTHILKWLTSLGHFNCPKTTPQKASIYKFWEDVFVAEVNKAKVDKNSPFYNKSMADIDLYLWSTISNRIT